MQRADPHELKLLRAMVRGAYDLQMLRMQAGLRLCANFRAKLKKHSEDELADGELSEEAKKIIAQLRGSYRRLTEGIARNRSLPARNGFVGDEIIGSYSELTLVDQYVQMEKVEDAAFRQLLGSLELIPIYLQYLAGIRGIGPAMAAVLVSSFDITKARHVSSFWKYAGLDVAQDGRGRSRRKEHLVERQYRDRRGALKTKLGVTYNPWLKTKLVGVLAGSFLRANSPWRAAYDEYRHRLESDPARVKITVEEWKRRYAAEEDVSELWAPGRIDKASKRYMVKMFLAEFWAQWRTLEGLPVTPTYQDGKLGQHHGEAA